MERIVKANVKQIVASYTLAGDLGSIFQERQAMQDGTNAHTAFLTARMQTESCYAKELPVSMRYPFMVKESACILEIGGRIDGIIREPGSTVIIEEIKTGGIPPESRQWRGAHACQVQLYACMYMAQANLVQCTARLIYIDRQNEKCLELEQAYTFPELKAVCDAIVHPYLERLTEEILRADARDQSVKTLAFPFDGYRKGQREMAVRVYDAIRGKYRLFARAPTGIGKTMAVLYAAFKAMPEHGGYKIFYLTARTTQAQAAENALALMLEKGLQARYVTVTAKAKACLKPEPICDPLWCEYARGYYDRIAGCLREIGNRRDLGAQTLEAYARKHTLCPFELCLDLALLSDCIICDYNYLFDPKVFLKRFFMSGASGYVFLADEAHNLVERSRDMYSPVLEKAPFLALKRLVPKNSPFARTITQCNAWFIGERKALGNAVYRSFPDLPSALGALLKAFCTGAESLLAENPGLPYKAQLLALYFSALFFLKGMDMAAEKNAKGSYVTTVEKSGGNLRSKLLCLDTSGFIRQKTSLGLATVFFSASLLPYDYFYRMFDGQERDRCLDIGSPFPRANLALARIETVSTRYKNRDASYMPLAGYILELVQRFPANYMVFFPSYAYMEQVGLLLQDCPIPLVCQQKRMTGEERDAFLAQFAETGSKLGLAVMGGIFGEGIDLAGSRLKGAIIVGVGLPQVSEERELIRGYYETTFGNGFHYAYTYPGYSRVLQAAGRVIRTETDTGIVILIDDRFSSKTYINLYPPEWSDMQVLRTREHFHKFLEGIKF